MSTQYVTAETANLRSAPAFGANIVGTMNLAQPLTITGDQQGDRWMPASIKVGSGTVSGFISKNVLRDPLSEPKEALIQETVKQWLRFGKGTRKENEEPFVQFVGEFWKSINMDLDGLDREMPWSAAFISYVVRKAGGYTGFEYAAAHARYVHKAIRAKLDGETHPFWGYRISDHRPALGDMVCRWRQKEIDYDYAAGHQYFTSHCDIVVSVSENSVMTIGGNVKHSVRHTHYEINNRGFLTGEGNVYAVLRNNL